MKKKIVIGALIMATLLVTLFLYHDSNSEPQSVSELESKIARLSSDLNIRKAILQMALGLNRIANGETNYDEIAEEVDKAQNCFFFLADKTGLSIDQADGVEDLVFNSGPKRRAYIKYNSHFGGTIVHRKPKRREDCDFEFQ